MFYRTLIFFVVAIEQGKHAIYQQGGERNPPVRPDFGWSRSENKVQPSFFVIALEYIVKYGSSSPNWSRVFNFVPAISSPGDIDFFNSVPSLTLHDVPSLWA